VGISGSRNCRNNLCDTIAGHYEILKLPFQKTVSELNASETKEYFQWFFTQIPIRLEILSRAIQAENAKNQLIMDYTQESLTPLSYWLGNHLHTLKKGPLEIQKEIENLPPRFRARSDFVVVDWKWSAETVSLCYDIGIYFAKIFQSQYENVKWTYLTKPRDWVYVNKPVLEGFKVHMSPYDLIMTCAVKMRKGKEGALNEMKRIFDFWKGEHILPGQVTGVYVRGKGSWTPD
jgi:hypothetical protein